MKKFIFITLGIIAGLIILFFAVGLFSKAEFSCTETRVINAPAEKIWILLNDLKGLPERRHEVIKIEILNNNNLGFKTWKEYTDMQGYILFEITEQIPEQLLTINMKESSFGMTGTWKYELVQEGQKTKVTISENSRIDEIKLRSLMTFIGRNSNIRNEFKLIEEGLRYN